MHSPSAAALFAPGLLLSLLAAQAPAPVAAAGSLPEGAPAAMRTITRADLLRDAAWLASDERGGRLTGSPGQVAAAKYITERFASLGLEPLGDVAEDGQTRGFLQHYGVVRTYVDASSELRLGALRLQQGFSILGGKPMDTKIEGKLRFVGLGRTRGSQAEIGPDEDLGGAVAVAVIRPPRGKVDRQLSVEEKFGMSFRSFGQLGSTTKNLEKKGARAVVFLMLEDPMGLADVLNYLAISPGKDSMAPRFPGADGQMAMMSSMFGGDGGVPSVVLSVPASKQVLTELGVSHDAALQFVNGDGELPDARQDLAAAGSLKIVVDDQATATNVVAVLRGSDEKLAAEAIVYSAHMDHVGMRMDGDVFNGADDNASGSAGLLAIAAAYAKSETRPKRSILFLSVSGEELGLWGSAYYADNPTWPADHIVANINTDMIGRSGPESGPTQVTVTPSNRHAMFSTLVRDAAGLGEQLGLSFESGDKYYMRSDHYNFAKKGIPVVFFCNGEHEDYHQVSDTADKLDGEKMERIARLAFWTGWNAANADERPSKLGKQDDWR